LPEYPRSGRIGSHGRGPEVPPAVMTAARGLWLHLDGVPARKMISTRVKKAPVFALTYRRLAEQPVKKVVSVAGAVAGLAACRWWPMARALMAFWLLLPGTPGAGDPSRGNQAQLP